MKSRIISSVPLIIATITNTACAQNTQNSKSSSNTNWSIEGVAHKRNHNGDSVWLNRKSDWQDVCTATIKGKAFRLDGFSDTVYMAVVQDDDYFKMPVVIEPGMNVRLDAMQHRVSGSPLNEQLYRYEEAYTTVDKQLDKVYMSLDYHQSGKKYDELENQRQQLWAERDKVMDSLAWQVYADNADNVVGVYIFEKLAKWALELDKLYLDTVHPRMDRVDAAFAVASPLVRNNESVLYYMNYAEKQRAVRSGNHYIDFPALSYPDMQPTTLSKLIDGRVAVIDFWASWCGPCRMEITNVLIPLYKKYADNGLVLVGIDVLDRLPEHDNASKQLKMPYPQIIDTTRFCSEKYGLESIPQVFVIDRDGTILGNYRGDELVKAVEKALASPNRF